MLTLDTIRDGAEGAAPRPPRRRPAAGDGHRPRVGVRLRRPADDGRRRRSTAWFRRGADRKSLELYLETFAHTFGVMQERDAIIRVAAECAEDLAADGVVYAEVRYAPELSTEHGPDARRGRRGEPRGFRIGIGARGRGRPPDRHEDARHGDAPGRPLGRGRRVRRPLARRRASSASTSPGPRSRLSARRATSTRSTTSAARTSTSRSTPASRSGCRRSGRRSSSCGAERLGPRRPDRRRHHRPRPTARWSSAGWPRSSATAACRSRCARPRTSTPVPRASIAEPPDRPAPPAPLPGDGRTRTTA